MTEIMAGWHFSPKWKNQRDSRGIRQQAIIGGVNGSWTRKLLSGLALAAAAALVLLVASPYSRQGERGHIGSTAEDFSFQLNGQPARLSDLRGKVVVLNFWATWCPPCKEEMPSMDRLYKRYKDHGFTIAAISIDGGGIQAVAAFVKKLGLTFPIGLDPTLDVANRYTVRALPSSFLIDREGNMVAVALGPRDWDGIAARAVVEVLLR
jgi:peroxiredoxin